MHLLLPVRRARGLVALTTFISMPLTASPQRLAPAGVDRRAPAAGQASLIVRSADAVLKAAPDFTHRGPPVGVLGGITGAVLGAFVGRRLEEGNCEAGCRPHTTRASVAGGVVGVLLGFGIENFVRR